MPSQLNVFLCKSFCGHGITLHSNRNTKTIPNIYYIKANYVSLCDYTAFLPIYLLMESLNEDGHINI